MKSHFPLPQLKKGQWAILEAFCEETTLALRLRLQEAGMTPGTLLQLIRFAPNNGPIQLKIGNAFLALRHQEALLLNVRPAH